MTPDSIESRMARLQQQVDDIEHDIRAMMPLGAQVAVLVSDMAHLREAHASAVLEARRGHQEILGVIAEDKERRAATELRAADRVAATRWQRIALIVTVCIAAGGNLITVALALLTR